MSQKNVRNRRRTAENLSDGSLFEAIVQRARQSGDFERAETVLEFCHPCALEGDMGERAMAEPNEFDFVASLIYESNEGIYLDCRLTKKIHEQGQCSIRIGIMKTLDAEMDTCKIMGELCGALMYHARSCIDAQTKGRTPAPRMAKASKRSHNRHRVPAGSQ